MSMQGPPPLCSLRINPPPIGAPARRSIQLRAWVDVAERTRIYLVF